VTPASGTTPPGTRNEQQAARWVQSMFAEVAPRYDLLNHLLSCNVDRVWRKALIACVRPHLESPGKRVLDLCCGTGDVLLDLQGISKANVMGADFCHPMLVAARHKAERRRNQPLLFEADALRLPLSDGCLDLISIAFGFRNLANYTAALEELKRVLVPGGVLAILEFSHPRSALVKLSYGLYSTVLLPLIGAIISGSREAYTYLPESIQKFPDAVALEEMIRRAGFAATSHELLTGGIAALHIGRRGD
jgi:demethylmenaquinone methyltransferase / 2-methoxy-6-polyprenyl-1,4-benzoquinol methylase